MRLFLCLKLADISFQAINAQPHFHKYNASNLPTIKLCYRMMSEGVSILYIQKFGNNDLFQPTTSQLGMFPNA